MLSPIIQKSSIEKRYLLFCLFSIEISYCKSIISIYSEDFSSLMSYLVVMLIHSPIRKTLKKYFKNSESFSFSINSLDLLQNSSPNQDKVLKNISKYTIVCIGILFIFKYFRKIIKFLILV